MSDASTAPQSDHSSAAGLNTSGPFNESAQNGVSFQTIHKRMSGTTLAINTAAGDLTLEDLEALQLQNEATANLIRRLKVNPLMQLIEQQVGQLGAPDARDFGKQFLSAMRKVNCNILVDDDLGCNASYVSYSFAEQNFGFPNQITMNPKRVDDRARFIISVLHEYFHAFQKDASQALKHSPFNPEERAVVHPYEWMHLELLCEQDASTKEAYAASLMAPANPSLSKTGLIRVQEFNEARASSPSLEYAMVKVALESLSRPYDRAHPKGPNWISYYQDVAIRNYQAGMWNRRDREEDKNLVFLRLEPEDYREVGDYKVGPNSFGEFVPEPLFNKRHSLNPAQQKKFDEMCAEYNIPPLEKCMTLREYNESLEPRAPRYAANASGEMVIAGP